MTPLKTIEYVMDNKGKKKKVMIAVTVFDKMREELIDLEDSLAVEKAKKEATGFKCWRDFVKELEA
jgi:hypothetical protein